MSWELYPRQYIFDESVFAFILNEKSGKFHNNVVRHKNICQKNKCGIVSKRFMSRSQMSRFR